jgi:dipeptidase D
MSRSVPGLVETSNNLATVKIVDSTVEIVTSQRSSVMSRLDEITEQIGAVADLAGASRENKNGYPAWQPDSRSPLVSRCVKIHEEMYGETPRIEVIHAGLECGVIGAKYPGMDMISIGPEIRGAHSPNERLNLASVAKTRDFLAGVLKAHAE